MLVVELVRTLARSMHMRGVVRSTELQKSLGIRIFSRLVVAVDHIQALVVHGGLDSICAALLLVLEGVDCMLLVVRFYVQPHERIANSPVRLCLVALFPFE